MSHLSLFLLGAFHATLNGEPITRTLYSNSFTQIYEQMKQQRGGEYEPNQMERMMMAEQAWELAIQKILMAREIEKLDITVSDAELVDFLRRNPHPTLQQVFQTEDGQFDIISQTAEVPGDAWTDFLPESAVLKSDWKDLDCGMYNTETSSCVQIKSNY